MGCLDDSDDEELGAYIYRTSRTAQLLGEEEAARNNNELSTKNNNKSNNILLGGRKSKRKKPPDEGDNVVSTVLSKTKVARKLCNK